MIWHYLNKYTHGQKEINIVFFLYKNNYRNKEMKCYVVAKKSRFRM